MNQNTFELTGKITFVEIKYNEKGNARVRTLMSKKGRNEGEYDTFGIDIFGKTAEEYADAIRKGDTVNLKGKIAIDKWEKDGKKNERYSLVAFEFCKAVYDEKQKAYVTEVKDWIK